MQNTEYFVDPENPEIHIQQWANNLEDPDDPSDQQPGSSGVNT